MLGKEFILPKRNYITNRISKNNYSILDDSKQEIELLESLQELKELNGMQRNRTTRAWLSAEERRAREQIVDSELIK